MAEVFKFHVLGPSWKPHAPNKGNIEELIAHTWEAQSGIEQVASRIYADATAILADTPSHRTGDSQITREHGDVDEYINLDDRRGQWAAGVIEFGRDGGGLDKNGDKITHMDAVAPLNQALPGHSRRKLKAR